jgi:hypothetical protein
VCACVVCGRAVKRKGKEAPEWKDWVSSVGEKWQREWQTQPTSQPNKTLAEREREGESEREPSAPTHLPAPRLPPSSLALFSSPASTTGNAGDFPAGSNPNSIFGSFG